MRGVTRLALALLGAFAVLLLTHYQLLRLPFYWDELGQFVPAALDIYQRGAWVPFSTVPNVHPPEVMAYLALIWRMTGFSILHTRVAMLLLSSVALLATWRLARKLTGSWHAAWLATVWLFVCPLFFAQAEMAQLDLPAMLLTTISLVLFLEERYLACALTCCAAVMAKETAIVAPALFGFLLLRRGKFLQAWWFLLPLAPLALWLFTLKRATGHLFGSPEFTDYNLFYPLHPVRLVLALLRRTYYLFLGSGHVIGTAALLWWLKKRGRALPYAWRVVFAFTGLHVAMISVLGGAVLERYLLPVLPVIYSAFAAAVWSLHPRLRRLATFALALCLVLACVINPPYPFPMENNLAWTTFVTLQKEASAYAEVEFPDATIATTFPFAGGFRRPELGYVSRPLRVLEVKDFRESNLTGVVREQADALIAYSVLWDPTGLLKKRWWVELLTRYYGYVPQAAMNQIPSLTGMRSVFRLCAAGQCVEVFRKTTLSSDLPGVRRPGAVPRSTPAG